MRGASGSDVVLSGNHRNRHVYVVGVSHSGKSKFLESLVRQDIRNRYKTGCGLMLLDWHGELYDYRTFCREGGMAEQHGASSDEYEDYYFRVLVTCKTADRRNNLIERLLQCEPPILSQVWVTTFDEVISAPLGSIWMRPKEYRDAINGSSAELRPSRSGGFAYRKQPARNAFVEAMREDAPQRDLMVVKPPEAKRGFVLLPRRWAVERTFAWATRFRRLARDYERLPQTLAGFHWIALACLMVRNLMNWN